MPTIAAVKVFRVLHHTLVKGGESWYIQREGAKRFALSGFKNKDDAVKRAAEMARKNKGMLAIHRKDGGVSETRSYVK